MKTAKLGVMALAGIISFAGLASAQGNQPEEIYVVRSVRHARGTPTGFCGPGKTGFSATAEDQFTFRSIAVGPDGRLTNADVQTVGDLRACYGSAAPVPFYAEGHLSGVFVQGVGRLPDCEAEFPRSRHHHLSLLARLVRPARTLCRRTSDHEHGLFRFPADRH